MQKLQDTIVAPSTPAGVSAIAVVRMSGAEALQIISKCFSKNLEKVDGYTLHYGFIQDENTRIDEVLVSVFRTPHSYTGENSVEISSHGSPYIVKRIMEVLLKCGARMADPGEFTLRAFLNKKLDLAQAEAVADMIHSNSEAGLQMAISQMRGGFSNDISALRQELIDFAALIELENDFGEEDVELANRPQLEQLVEKLLVQIEKLKASFAAGNVLKNGISTVIAGKPNAGKSTLLNALLNEERAIVSDIAGTTRDTIEEVFTLNGVQFRLIDTAGLRESDDTIEQIGVGKAKQQMEKAELLIYLHAPSSQQTVAEVISEWNRLPQVKHKLLVLNKIDATHIDKSDWPTETLFISAKTGNIESLTQKLTEIAANYQFGNETIVNNVRHAEALGNSATALQAVLDGLNTGISSDLVALDIRNALYHLGLITGEVTNEDVLDSIFSRFCIGK
ncbi:MAG: tRNA uridine-5-carboxymethylaminomethyl(34) synthesis GTPase MnmE [Flavobacteriales bacterium]|nr:tRNA uridine-5-carboxymethylaminomethyl(34) synthesis GTPase MnmE [Flavobacteriales bacterium]